MALSNASKAGVAIFVGTVQAGIFLILSEIYYPNYNVSANAFSDLGATCPSGGGTCIINQPAAAIFDFTAALAGVLVLVGAYYLQKAFHWKPATAVISLAGIGALGVGFFPETTGIVHSVSSLVLFLFGGLSAVVTARFQRKPLFYFSIVLGFITLVSLVLRVGGNYLGLGTGGMERMVVYPMLLWAIGFGGHLMATDGMSSP